MKIWKEVIRTGKHVYVRPDGTPAIKDATPADIQRWAADGNQMLALGLPIPVPLEHDRQAHPKNHEDLAAGKVKNNAGFAATFKTDVIKDAKTGEDVHRLLSQCDIRDVDAARGIKNKTIPFCSPWFSSFVDGKGREWNDVVAHIALTTTPRIADQAPFDDIDKVMLSISDKPLDKNSDGAFISRAGLLAPSGKPRYPAMFSLATGVKLSTAEDDEVAKEGKEIGEERAKEKMASKDEDAEAKEDKRWSPLDDDVEDEASADVDLYEMVGHLLMLLGCKPPDMSEETFGRDVYETLMAKIKQEMADKHNSEANKDPNQMRRPMEAGARQPNVEQPPMMYSIQQLTAMPAADRQAAISKITDATRRQDVEAFFSQQAQIVALKQKTIDDATKARDSRVDACCKQLPKEIGDKLRAIYAGDGAKLSLSDAGAIVDPNDAHLSMYEDMAKSLQDSLKKAGQNISEVPQPIDGSGINDADAAKLAEEMVKRGGRMANTGSQPAV